MANWTDTETLVNYLRHAFITCDETGICEAVIQPPTKCPKPGGLAPERFEGRGGEEGSEEEDSPTHHSPLSHSPDIHCDPGHRGRSNTAKQLELLKQQRQSQGKQKVIVWKQPGDLNPEDLQALFPLKPTCGVPVQIPTTSLTEKLKKNRGVAASNPFQVYARFEATSSLGIPSKSFGIFLHMLEGVTEERPMTVRALASCKVADLIGLICFKYHSRNMGPPLTGLANHYSLHMAEDTGEIEADLPPLNPGESVHRLGFPHLALVPRPLSSQEPTKQFVTAFFPNGESYKLEFESLNVPLLEVRDKALAARASARTVLNHSQNLEYNVEKVAEPDSALSLEATVQQAGTTVFVIVRKNSSRGDFVPGGRRTEAAEEEPSSSSPPTIYQVEMVHKFKGNTPVHIVIQRDCVEISNGDSADRPGKGPKLLRSTSTLQKNLTIPLDQIGGCEIMEEKNNRTLFHIIHRSEKSGNSGQWRSHYFEAEPKIAEELSQALSGQVEEKNPDLLNAFRNRPIRKPSIFKRLQPYRVTIREKSTD